MATGARAVPPDAPASAQGSISAAPECSYCGLAFGSLVLWKRKTKHLDRHRDHLYPRAAGGGGGSNLVPACSICNLIKGSRVFESFAEARLYVLSALVKSDFRLIAGPSLAASTEPARAKPDQLSDPEVEIAPRRVATPPRACLLPGCGHPLRPRQEKYHSRACRSAAWESLRALGPRPAAEVSPVRKGVLCALAGCGRRFSTSRVGRYRTPRRYCSPRCRSAAWDAEHPRVRPVPSKPLARRGRQALPGHVRLTLDGRGGWGTRVAGISTDILAARMRAGESIEALCEDYLLTREWVEDAIRWELIPRRSRVRLVEALVKAGAQ